MDLGLALGGTYFAAALCFYLACKWRPRERRRYYEKPIPPRHPRQTKRGW